MARTFSKPRGLSVVVAAAVLGLSACCKSKGGGFATSNGEPQIGAQSGVTAPTPAEASVDFGAVPLGQTKTLTLSLENTGIASLTIVSFKATTADPEFTLDLAEGSVVQSGAPLSIPVHFTPFSVGQKTAVYLIQTDSADVPQITLTLGGDGVKLVVTVTPEGIDFGKVVVHTPGKAAVTIANGSGVSVTLAVSAVQGAQAMLFGEGTLSSPILAAGQSVTLPVTYSPTQVTQTPDTAFFTVGYCDGCTPVTVNLRGEAVDTGLSVTPNPLDFGFDPPGTPVTKSIKLQNVANRVIHMTSQPLLNPGSAQAFALAASAPAFPLAIQPGTEVDVPVVFTPPTLGQYSGSLGFTSDDPQAGEVTVPLAGIGGGGQIQCLPPALSYGTVALAVPVTQKVLCTNVGQDVPGVPGATLQITALSVPDDAAFSAHFDQPFPAAGLTAGQSAFIDVVYTATSTSGDSGHLQIASNDAQTPVTVVPLNGTGSNLPPCDFTINPPGGLQFGFVQQGASAQLQFSVVNQGTSDCLLNGLSLAGTSDPSFSLPGGPIASQTLSYPGNPTGASASLPVTVQFAPTQYGNFSGDVTFTVSDPTNPQQDVHLAGTSEPGCLLIAPNDLDFGVVGVNPANGAWCSSTKRQFTAYNTCNYDVHITSITMNPGVTGNEFALSGQPATYPVDVPPGSTPVTFQVAFEPTVAGTALGSLSIATQEMPAAPYLVTFKGEANANAQQTDTFVQSSAPKVDILWVIDNDDNGEVQQLVAQNIGSFMQYAINQGIDYHIAVTSDDVCQGPTSDDGSFEPCSHCAIQSSPNATIVTQQTQDPEGTLANLITLGQSGGCDDPLFEPAYEALQPSLLSGHNSGFLRPDAYLAIIGVSDGDDDSPQSVQFYYNFFESIKGFQNASMFSFSAVNQLPSDPAAGCANGLAYDGSSVTRVPQMVQMTGGVNVDICTTNWGTALTSLGNVAFGGRLSFPLTATPANPSSIEVQSCYQGGCTTEPSQLPNGFVEWHYDPTTNSIVFDPNAAPLPGDTINVTYSVACS